MWAVGNILNRAYDYFQDFSKCLSIFNKALKLQKIRKRTKQKRERELELTCRPGLAQLGPAHWLPPVIPLLSPGGREARGRRPQPHAGHLLLLPTPRTSSTSATHSPSSPSHFPHSPRAPLPPLALSPFPPERNSSPPSPFTAAIDPLSSLHVSPSTTDVFLFLTGEPRRLGRTATPLAPSSSTSVR